MYYRKKRELAIDISDDANHCIGKMDVVSFGSLEKQLRSREWLSCKKSKGGCNEHIAHRVYFPHADRSVHWTNVQHERNRPWAEI